jgi:hypothetical protein
MVVPFHCRDNETSARSPISTSEPSSNRKTALDPFVVRISSPLRISYPAGTRRTSSPLTA